MMISATAAIWRRVKRSWNTIGVTMQKERICVEQAMGNIMPKRPISFMRCNAAKRHPYDATATTDHDSPVFNRTFMFGFSLTRKINALMPKQIVYVVSSSSAFVRNGRSVP